MNRSIPSAAGLLVAVAVPLLSFGQGAAGEPKCIERTPACARTIEFLDLKAGCEYTEYGTEIYDFAAGTYQLRGRIERDRSVNVSGLPGSDGWLFVTVNADADLATQKGIVWGTFLKMFDDFSATVYGTYTGDLNGVLFSGHATGRGTGEFQGYLFEADLQPLPVSEIPGGDPCPGGSITGNGQSLASIFRIDPGAGRATAK